MKKMKKALCLVLAVLMVLALAACGEKVTPETSSAPPATESTAPATESTAPATESDAPVETGDTGPSGDTAWNQDNIGEHKFILAHGLAETSMTGVQYHEFALAVEELSGGKIKVEERIGGSLVTDAETLDALLDGTIDFCHSMVAYVSGTIPGVAPLTVPGYYGGDDWLGFAEQTYDLLDSIYGDFGIKYLGPVAQGNSCIIDTEKQIKAPSDVAGQTFRASGTWVSKTISAWGGAAVTINLPDLADSFSKKTVQGVATGLNIVVPFKLYEVAKYVTRTTMSESFGALLMSEQAWSSLNDDEKALITEAGKVFTEKSYDHALYYMDTYMKEIEDSGRNEIYDLTEAEQSAFTDLSFGLYDEMSDELGQKGNDLIALLKEIAGK
jgi:TRAP-type C4-dicarboxylate transport system substrate-binding protein